MLILGYSTETQQWKKLFDFIGQTLAPSQFSVQFNPPKCEICFCSYHDLSIMSKKYPTSILVFISGEPTPVRPQKISLLIDCKKNARSPMSVIYFPFYALSFLERSQHGPMDLIKTPTQWEPIQILKNKNQFCAYMYRYDLPHRVQLLEALQQYRAVEILGRSRNPAKNYRPDGNPYDDAVKKYQPFKFVICAENHFLPGYVTEKIVNAMLARAIPIYLGAPDIVEHFNPKSFINVNSFPSLTHMVAYVQQVDQNEQLYLSILREPWLINNQLTQFLLLDRQYQNISQWLATKLGKNRPLPPQPSWSSPLTLTTSVPRRPIRFRNDVTPLSTPILSLPSTPSAPTIPSTPVTPSISLLAKKHNLKKRYHHLITQIGTKMINTKINTNTNTNTNIPATIPSIKVNRMWRGIKPFSYRHEQTVKTKHQFKQLFKKKNPPL